MASLFGDAVVFRVRDPRRSPTRVGEAEITAGYDRIEVRGAKGDRIVLKYHWIPTLCANPPVRIEPAAMPGSVAPLLAIRPQGLEDFSIVAGARRCDG